MIKFFLKGLYLLLTFTIYVGIVKGQSYTTFKPGKLWFDTEEKIINAHGGGILYHDNIYYWFGEHKGERTNNAQVGVTCYSSKDLYNWKFESIALPAVDDKESPITRGSVIERPKVIYNEKTRKFVMYFHLELKGQGYNAAHTGIAVSDQVAGPYKLISNRRINPRRWPINVTDEQKNAQAKESDFEKSWTAEWLVAMGKGLFLRRDFPGGQMSRDMTLYVDDDGKAYHIYSSEDNASLHIAELSDDYQSHTGKYSRIMPAKYNEAPAIFKRNGIYWMIASGCTGWAPNAARMFSSKSIYGPWEEHPNPCVGKGSEFTFYSQSTFILPIQGTDQFIFMADRWMPENPIDGRYVWLPIIFENDKPVLKWQDEWKLEGSRVR